MPHNTDISWDQNGGKLKMRKKRIATNSCFIFLILNIIACGNDRNTTDFGKAVDSVQTSDVSTNVDSSPTADAAVELKWYADCGDPVCGGHREQPGIPLCTENEKEGLSCTTEGAKCDPLSDCNQLLHCAKAPVVDPNNCPISKRQYKSQIRYLTKTDQKQMHEKLKKLKLAKYKLKTDDANAHEHLGFIIEDGPPTVTLRQGNQTVDLYGFTSLVAAAVQAQADDINSLRKELIELKKQNQELKATLKEHR